MEIEERQKETRCPRCYALTINGPGRPCDACIEDDQEEEARERRKKEAAARLDKVIGILNRARLGEATLKGHLADSERLGALVFACEYAVAQLKLLKEGF